MKIRLDQLLVKKMLAPSRTKAQDMIRSGEVMVGGEVAENPSLLVGENCEIRLLDGGATLKFVSRAGLKLESALKRTRIPVEGLVCLDIGQSTGGFTEALLAYGAREVWGLDVGHGQLHPRLRDDARVKFFENLDVREAVSHPELATKSFDIVVVDVSFISLEKVLRQIYHFLKPRCHALLLVKPQFELDKSALNKQGVVKDPSRIADIEQKLRTQLSAENFEVLDFFATDLKGKDGNQEYFFHVRK